MAAQAHPPTPPSLKKYPGNCHCGAFKFHVLLPELDSVTECNCSICFKKSYKWIYPLPENFTIEKGSLASLSCYTFGKDELMHLFCPTCGTPMLAMKDSEIQVNARALQNLDLWSLQIKHSNGSELEPTYTPPHFTGPEPEADIAGGKMYTGSCHCGAITIALKTRGPLADEEEVIGECDCSICARLGRILTYRPPSQISLVLAPPPPPPPDIGLSSYAFGTTQFQHKFCSKCGVSVVVDDVVEGLRAVNLRCFDVGDGEWEEIRKRIYWHEGRKEGDDYVIPE